MDFWNLIPQNYVILRNNNFKISAEFMHVTYSVFIDRGNLTTPQSR
jgi:hypothetical protein